MGVPKDREPHLMTIVRSNITGKRKIKNGYNWKMIKKIRYTLKTLCFLLLFTTSSTLTVVCVWSAFRNSGWRSNCRKIWLITSMENPARLCSVANQKHEKSRSCAPSHGLSTFRFTATNQRNFMPPILRIFPNPLGSLISVR